MASKYWIKLYHEILDDPKMGMLDDYTWRMVIEIFLVCGENNNSPVLPDVMKLAWRLRKDESEISEALDKLESMGIVHRDNGCWIVTHFEERQGPVSGAERMKRLRERNQTQQYYVTNSVTKRHVDKEPESESEYIEEEGETPEFIEMRNMLSELTGLPPTHADIPAIEECVRVGVVREDVEGALQWRKDNHRGPVKVINQLVQGIMTNRSIRVQGDNAKPHRRRKPSEPMTKEKLWEQVEKYGLEH